MGAALMRPRSGQLRQRPAALAVSVVLAVGLFLSLGMMNAPARAAVTAPTLTLSSVTATSVKLSWNASAGAVGYRV